MTSDGVNTYTYNFADRLTRVQNATGESYFEYNGLGDRVRQTTGGIETNYSLDLNTGLTQVLADGTNTYLYGPSAGSGQAGRIAQETPENIDYFLPDGLGSVRQVLLDDSARTVVLARDNFSVSCANNCHFTNKVKGSIFNGYFWVEIHNL